MSRSSLFKADEKQAGSIGGTAKSAHGNSLQASTQEAGTGRQSHTHGSRSTPGPTHPAGDSLSRVYHLQDASKGRTIKQETDTTKSPRNLVPSPH